MNNLSGNSYRKYFKNIKKELPCSSSMKAAFINNFKEIINEYIRKNPDTTIDDVIKEFGNEKEIARGFDSYNNDALKKQAKKYFYSKLLIIILTVVLVIAIIILIVVLKNIDNVINVTTD